MDVMALIAAIIVAVTLIVMTSGKVPAVFALIVALVLSGLIGIADASELYSGLSNGGVITIAAMLVIAKGVLSTGVITRVTVRLLDGVGSSVQTLTRLIPPVGVLSALINTTPIVAMVIPATKELQQREGIPARSVLLPIAHATTLAGSVTLIGTSSNLIIAGLAEGSVSLSMFSFAPIALPVALVGWVVLVISSRYLLKSKPKQVERTLSWRVEIPFTGTRTATGRSAEDLGLKATVEFELQEVRRWGQKIDIDSPLESGDLLVYQATEPGVSMLWMTPQFNLEPHHLFAVTVDAHSPGTYGDLEEDEDLMVVAAETDEPFGSTPARPGEMCFVSVSSRESLEKHPFVGLWQGVTSKAPQPGKAWLAVGILVAVIISATFGLARMELIAPAGAAAMVLTGVLTPRSAARALDWNILAVIAGSIGLGVIVVQSGLGDYISDAIIDLSAGNKVLVVLVFAIGTTLLTNLVTNAAAASILTPVALVIAATPGIDMDPVLLLTLIGTCISFTFLNPYSHQSNMMVMGPGKYTNGTFMKFGIPITLVSVAAAFAVTTGLVYYG